MANYRVLLHHLTSGTLLAEVRVTAAKWQVGLNGAGSAQVAAPTTALLDALDPLASRLGATALSIVRPDGTVAFSGPLWDADVALDGTTTLTAAGTASMLQRRVVRSTLTYTSVDQATIAAALVNHAQDTSGGRTDRDLRISTAGVTTHGVLRTASWPADEAKPIREALASLADTDNGFTWALTPLLGASMVLTYQLDLTYPNTGVASTVVLVNRANCLVSKVAMTATGMVTDVVARGGGSAARLVTRRGSGLAGWPCLEGTRSWTDTTNLAALQAAGDRALVAGSAPALAPSLQVLDVQAAVDVDTLVRLAVPEVGLDGTYRVLAVDTALVDGTAVSTLSVANAELYGAA